MRLLGDVPDEHRQLAADLEEMEEALADMDYISKEYVAKGMVCLAHDWYDLGVDEEGQRLIAKAEKTCPGYFTNFVRQHTAEDPHYDTIVKRLFSTLISLLISTLKS